MCIPFLVLSMEQFELSSALMHEHLKRVILDAMSSYLSSGDNNPLKSQLKDTDITDLLRKHGDAILELCVRLRNDEISIVDFNLEIRKFIQGIQGPQKDVLDKHYFLVKEKIDRVAHEVKNLLRQSEVMSLVGHAYKLGDNKNHVKKIDVSKNDEPKSDMKKFEHNLGGEFELWLLNNKLNSGNATVMYYLASEFDKPKTYRQIADATGISIEYIRVIATRLKIDELKPPFQIIKSAHKPTRSKEATFMLTKKSND